MLGDVVVVGGGAIGLAVAHALAGRQLRVLLIEHHREGEASPAAAGMLAPGPEFGEHPAIQAFVTMARDRYPAYVDTVRAHSGHEVPLDRSGIIQVAMDEQGAGALRTTLAPEGEWLDARTLATLEPNLTPHIMGAVWYASDGAVDPRALLAALTVALDRSPHVTRITGSVHTVEFTNAEETTAVTTNGTRHTAPHLVIAAGAWAPQIQGLPRPLPIEPLRGQILSLGRAPTRHVIYGPRGYLVPRTTIASTEGPTVSPYTLVGSTMERVGFQTETTPSALRALRAMAQQLCPGLEEAPEVSAWAGLRPATPDLLPIIGRDPDEPSLLYACGHSRNGILMAPLTAESIAALILREPAPADLTPFRIDRFTA